MRQSARERLDRALHDLYLSPSFATFTAVTAAIAAVILAAGRKVREVLITTPGTRLMEWLVAGAIVALLAAIAIPQIRRVSACNDANMVADVAASNGRAAISFNAYCSVTPQQALDLLEQVARDRQLTLVPNSWRAESNAEAVHRVWFEYKEVTGGAGHEHHPG